MMRGKVLCILKEGKCACIHQYYSENSMMGEYLSGSSVKLPFLRNGNELFFISI